MDNLTNKKCIPCEGGMPHLMADEIEKLRKEVPEWEIANWHELKRKFNFKNFAEALAFVNKVGALAESEGHHPDIKFCWGYVEITLFTHAVDGLSENDFILAAKIDALR
jgi:4a-hydroxytetrahydrobiopterin dehydratase